MNKLQAIALILVITGFALSAYAYNEIPLEKVATHWNAAGEADGFMEKGAGLFLFPIASLVLFGLLQVIPRIDPLKKNVEGFRQYYDGFVVVFLLFFVYIQTLSIVWNLGHDLNMSIMILPAIGALLYYTGVLMDHSKRNWFIGIRTPWTLSNDKVWEKTHALAGKLFKVTAAYLVLLMFFEGLVTEYFIWFILVPLLIAAFGPVVYSYWIFSKLKPKA
ncbi:SdpI family protein [archaeon]|nr:SdpI family protein [archaeon]